MGLLNDAIARQDSKRIKRLSNLAKAQKKESSRQKFGTLVGRNLTDGTAIVLLDGDITPTSGFRLISNANVVNGDRVAIRKTDGLWRADALNVKEEATIQEVESPILLYARLFNLTVNSFGFPAQLLEFTSLAIPMAYGYSENLSFQKKTAFSGEPTTISAGMAYTPNFVGEDNFISVTLTDPRIAICSFEVEFPPAFSSLLAPMVGEFFGSTLDTSPLEAEVIVNGILSEGSDTFNLLIVTTNSIFYRANNTTESQTIDFSFRFRKRGVSRWFDLR